MSFYKMDPAAWDFGTAKLTLEQEAAYLRIVNAIHAHCAPVPDVDRVLAGMFRCSPRKARALIRALVEAGKLVIEDGVIWNERARSDLFQRGFMSISRAESGAKGGRKRAENAAKALNDNDTHQASASSREEKRREEKIEADASISSPPQKDPPGFGEFWAAYPRKVAKGAARKAWAKAMRTADPPTVIAAASRVEDRGEYTPHPATWLNAERWNDEEPPHDRQSPQQQPRRPGGGSSLFDAAARLSDRFAASRGDRGDAPGDDPGGPGTHRSAGGAAAVALLATG